MRRFNPGQAVTVTRNQQWFLFYFKNNLTIIKFNAINIVESVHIVKPNIIDYERKSKAACQSQANHRTTASKRNRPRLHG
jgi:hypothetical protein